MKPMIMVLVASIAACSATTDPQDASEFVMPDTCLSDDDCRSGAECENAWCRADGTCRRGTPTGFECGNGGMCVDSLCIETD